MTQSKLPVWWSLGLLLAIELVILYRLQGPAAKDDAAPLEEFSAARAVAVLRRILGDESPHPAGTPANGQVRDRLVTELRSLGLVVELQECDHPNDSNVKLCNVLARLPDTPESGQPLVLATHYDSVSAGPGAADAGSCVAALLEAARALQHGGPYRRPVFLLITDGEELGLKGAAAFVPAHPLARQKPFVLNFDARGSSGPSLMYETHRGNLGTVRWMARCLPRPSFTGSSYVTVYRYMPNDSDFSVFSRDGWTGLNFAFIGGAHNYHTANDTLANLDWRSVQHHGDNALELARFIASSEEIELQATEEDAIFFDVLGTFVVYFPQSWAWPLSVAAFVILAACAVSRAGRRVGVRSMCLTVCSQLLAGFLAGLLGWALARGMIASGWLPEQHVVHERWMAALLLATLVGHSRRNNAHRVPTCAPRGSMDSLLAHVVDNGVGNRLVDTRFLLYVAGACTGGCAGGGYPRKFPGEACALGRHCGSDALALGQHAADCVWPPSGRHALPGLHMDLVTVASLLRRY